MEISSADATKGKRGCIRDDKKSEKKACREHIGLHIGLCHYATLPNMEYIFSQLAANIMQYCCLKITFSLKKTFPVFLSSFNVLMQCCSGVQWLEVVYKMATFFLFRRCFEEDLIIPLDNLIPKNTQERKLTVMWLKNLKIFQWTDEHMQPAASFNNSILVHFC